VSEEDLDRALEAARRGEEWGVTLLYRALNPAVLRYLEHQAREVADDLAAETWVAAVRGLSGFQGSSSDFRVWLFTVARNRVVDHRRRQGRRPTISALDQDVDAPGPIDVALQAIDALSVRQAMALLVRELPKAQAEVIVLRVLADLSVEEVAQITGRSAGSVRVLQHRGLRKLEKIFARFVTK
jgi:RNA polymerase sigma-70 factor (ECF subfamily)